MKLTLFKFSGSWLDEACDLVFVPFAKALFGSTYTMSTASVTGLPKFGPVHSGYPVFCSKQTVFVHMHRPLA